jgi:hypothetical protein
MMTPEEEIEWIKAMVELEEQRGPIVPDGAVGGLVARARREQTAAAGGPQAMPLAATRARGRVRSSFRAIEKPNRRAA